MNYLIAYNHNQLSFNPNDIHQTITKLDGVVDWWHYLPSVYIINTQKDEKAIADSIISRHPGLLFLIVEVNLNKYNGVLNKNAWEWINRKIRSVLRFKPAPQPPATNLFDFLSNPNNLPAKKPVDIMDILKKRVERGY